ncbi:lipocalin-like protein [Luteimonas cucumeris]|uniref:Lipocalin-like protein n=1 Tax=Luteimonas cucumeris TaxID=985012 RepID=A0A562L8C9_9GAMM|nr:lipocalin-like domain-containing protein [Luteimonas cucumeris]TWI03932.1 lipocalin-like protein [Luteimonas cucumeris]
MLGFRKTALVAMSWLCLLTLLPPANAAEQTTPNPLLGTWTLVSVDSIKADGSRVALYGSEPKGVLIFDGQGRYASQIMRAQRPRFASGKKSNGTAEEYKAATQGVNAHFGEYAVDTAAGLVSFHIQHALFPNWEGTTQDRKFTLANDVLTYSVPVPTSGDGASDEVVWRRTD